MFELLKYSFKDKFIRSRVLYTLYIIVFFRLLAHITLPGIDASLIKNLDANPLLSQLNIVSGSALTSFSLVALGLSPYISASIIIQFLQMGLSRTVKEWGQQGKIGRNKLNLLTRFLVLILSVTQTMSVLTLLKQLSHINLMQNMTMIDKGIIMLGLITGAMVTTFIAEKITERGIGTGMSMIILIGIISSLPLRFTEIYEDLFVNTKNPSEGVLPAILIGCVVIALIIITTLFQQATYRLDIQHTNNITKSTAFLPIKLNPAGVMPVIFTSMVITMPNYLPKGPVFQPITNVLQADGFASNILFITLIITFSIIYGLIQVNPEKTAESLGKSNAYLLNIRPGKPTELYLRKIIINLSIFGGLFLSAIAITPRIMTAVFGTPPSFAFFGTSLLIMIGTAIETVNQLEGLAMQNTYKKII